MDAPYYRSVSSFFAGRSIFVTGGTGFMGKVLVEKLLRSCPEIKNIYLLMRPKRGQDVNSRLRELLNAPLFERLRSEREEDLMKIVPIQGDITDPELGISQHDQLTLAETVSIVFHSAATVKFDEALKLSVTINILGTKRLVNLCHSMRNLVMTFGRPLNVYVTSQFGGAKMPLPNEAENGNGGEKATLPFTFLDWNASFFPVKEES